MTLDGNSELARAAIRDAREITPRLGDLLLQSMREVQQALSRGREPERHRFSLEKGQSVEFLERFHLVRNGRLRQVQAPCGLGEAVRLRNRRQGAQVAQFQRRKGGAA